MSEYKMKDSLGYSQKAYMGPTVSYFGGNLEAGENTVSALAKTAAAVALALVALAATAARGSESPLE
ncbi:MAG: hypothetical protein JW700_03465 [Candidatus Aenigmarchaeota archaeon]|nr:hypothetical protein [Candidatus Aenigmarchaeota archaeon]